MANIVTDSAISNTGIKVGDGEWRMYIPTMRRMASGELLRQRNGFSIFRGYETEPSASGWKDTCPRNDLDQIAGNTAIGARTAAPAGQSNSAESP